LRDGKHVSRAALARAVLTSNAAGAILAQHDATTFLGRKPTTEEDRADSLSIRRTSMAPKRIAERILASRAFYDFVNSALPVRPKPAQPARPAHHPSGR